MAHHEMGQIGESECVHLFVRMLDTYACLVTRGVAEAPWPGILPDAINRKLKTSEPMRVLFNTLIKVSPIRWQRVLEDFRVMRSLLNKVILLTADGLTKELCIGAYLFAR